MTAPEGQRATLFARVLRVAEFDSVVVDPDDILTNGKLDIYPNLHRKGYIEVRLGTAEVRLAAKGYIGVIPVNERLTLEILPRVPITNLSHLLTVSKVAPAALVNATRLYETDGQLYPSLAVVYATALRRVVEVIVGRGLYREYERIEELTSFPRGRIEIGRTMQAAFARGNRHKVVMSYFHRSVDNPVNQCLVYAVWRLSKYLDQVSGELVRRHRQNARLDLNYAWHALQGVELDLSEGFLNDGLVTGQLPLPTLRSYYRPALDLALTVIGRQAVVVEQSGSRIELPSLVVDMSAVFENYVREVLKRVARQRAWVVEVLDGNKQPPEGGSGRLFQRGETPVSATPDVVLRDRARGAATYPLIVEVKYKPAGNTPERDDLNQAITYGAAYHSPVVVVAQPRAHHSPKTAGMHFVGTIAEMKIFQYVVDLDGDMEHEERRLLESVEGLLGRSR